MKKSCLPILLCVAASLHAPAQTPAPASASDIQTRHKVISQALAAAARIKAAVAQYYLHNKAFPSSNAELGMNLPAAYRTYDLKSIALNPGGVIDLTLTASSGVDNGVIHRQHGRRFPGLGTAGTQTANGCQRLMRCRRHKLLRDGPFPDSLDAAGMIIDVAAA